MRVNNAFALLHGRDSFAYVLAVVDIQIELIMSQKWGRDATA